MEYKHFSHPHNLNIHKVQPSQQPPLRCSGCESLCRNPSSSIYACWQCSFFLHDHCGNATRYVKHPSHPSHHLTLLSVPTYCSGSFLCNACGVPGGAFSYSCAPCEVDLHVGCTFLPPKITHRAHQHDLMVAYGSDDGKGSSAVKCGICHKDVGGKYWRYKCGTCEFSTHTFCGSTEVKMGLYQMEDPADDVVVTPAAGGSGAAVEVQVELTEDQFVELYNLQVQMQLAKIMAELSVSSN
ncbi:hypothetical protein LguiB_004461 [Lonicera macranthoides]